MTAKVAIGRTDDGCRIRHTARLPASKRRRALSFALIAVLLLAIVVPNLPAGLGAESYNGSAYDVVYHSNDGSGRTFKVSYHGSFVSTEYNPQFWKGTVKESGGIAEYEPDDWNPITDYTVGKTEVFCGWGYYSGFGESGTGFEEVVDPGDIIRPAETRTVHLYATWKVLNYTALVNSSWNLSDALSRADGGNQYTNIIRIASGYSVDLPTSVDNPVTIRGESKTSILNLGGSNHSFNANATIDNLALRGTHSPNHGDGSGGLFANGHTLVLGTGIDTGSSTAVTGYPQLYGGSASNSVWCGSTDLVVHSGIYGNVFGGSGPNGGYIAGDCRAVLRNVTILDTLAGGSANDAKSIGGSTWIFAVSLSMPGDYYEETSLGNAWSVAPKLTESTIITGGSNGNNGGSVAVSTNILLTGNTEVWDVQGGGRRGQTEIGDANLEISGSAVVKHIACGGITDGASKGSNVNNVDIRVADSAKVAMLLGGGYDTWGSPSLKSTVTGDIRIAIEGGTVGYVYGGGFRGAVGSESTKISIAVTGGEILGDVYGGGRGGFDKVLHGTDGSLGSYDGNGFADTTGCSKVTAESVSIEISGDASVLGSVYGGGQSTPVISSYNDKRGLSGKPIGTSYLKDVAAVDAESISISVDGRAHVGGSIFAGGKGISASSLSGNGSEDYLEWTNIICMDRSGAIRYVPWFGTGSSVVFDTGFDYSAFASSSSMSADSSRTVSVQNGTVDGSVYGGGAIGATSVAGDTSVSIGNGRISGSVYGGGMGLEGDDVAGRTTSANVRVTIGAGTYGPSVGGSVYGGGEQSRTIGDISVDIGECTIEGNVFSGGLGAAGNQSTEGRRELNMDAGLVKGSVYGSSAFGDDGSSSKEYGTVVRIQGGTVAGSVYGGGFKGMTWGNTKVMIEGAATIGMSVFGGADVGKVESKEEFEEIKVSGLSRVEIYGGNGASIGGSVFGSGHSCLVDGMKTVLIQDVPSGTVMASVQNADSVLIVSSHLELTGRADGTSSQASTKYSLNNISSLTLSNGTRLNLDAGTNDISEYHSRTTGADGVGNDTSESNPRNVIRLNDGVSFDIAFKGAYGKVFGYTVLSIAPSELYYGALASGSVQSEGGFVVERGGSYSLADTQDISDCRCWFISGAVLRTTTLVAVAGTGSNTVIESMPRLSSGTRLVYTGHSVASGQTSRMTLVSGAPDQSGTQFRLTMGYAETNCLAFGDGGVVIHGLDSSVEIEGVGGKDCAGIAFKLEHAGIRYTGLAGSIDLSFVEAVQVTLDGGDTGYIYQNRIDVRLDVYTEVPGGIGGDYEVPIAVCDGRGTGGFVIPKSFYEYKLILKSFDLQGMTGSGITIAPGINTEGTLGWAHPLADAANPSANMVIGTLTGSFNSTVVFELYGAAGGEIAELHFVLESIDGTSIPFKVTVTTDKVEMVNITFIDYMTENGSLIEIPKTISIASGSTIPSSMVPVTGDCFIGWFQDRTLKNPFNLSNPVVHDRTVYAGYKFTVTFDLMNGKTLTDYADYPSGSRVFKPSDPVRDGFSFVDWFKDPDATVPAFVRQDGDGLRYEDISGDTTFYAGWKGDSVEVSFVFVKGTIETVIGTLNYEYGNVYSLGKSPDGSDFDSLTKKAVSIAEQQGMKFVRWRLADESSERYIYGDMELSSSKDHALVADCAVTALSVKLNSAFVLSENGFPAIAEDRRFGDIAINAPREFLVYETSGIFAFTPSNATTVGYHLDEWRFKGADGAYHGVVAGSVLSFQLKDGVFVLATSEGDVSIEGNELVLETCWKLMTYEVHVQNPAGGRILCKESKVQGSAIRDVPYGTILTFEYVPEGPYVLKSWELSGEGRLAQNGNTCSVTVEGNCLLYVRLGGLYTASVSLTIDGSPAPDAKLKLSSGSRERSLAFLETSDGRSVFHNTGVETGYYDLLIQQKDGTWLAIKEGLLVQNGSSWTLDLFSIVVKDGNGKELDRKIVGYPCYSVADADVEVTLPSKGYDHGTARSDDAKLTQTDGCVTFAMPAKATIVILDGFGPKTWTVRFDGGVPGLKNQTDSTMQISYGGTYRFPELNGKDGYTFSHWEWLDNDGSIRQYKSDIFEAEIGMELLKAVWLNEEVGYTVVLNRQTADGTGYVAETLYRAAKAGTRVSVDLEKVPDGFHVSTGHPGEKLEGEASSDLVLVAYHDRDVYTVTAKIVIGGSSEDLGTRGLRYGEAWSTELFGIPYGYRADGWYLKEDLSDRTASVPLGDGDGSSMDLYVKGTPRTFRITYDPAVDGAPTQYVYGSDPVEVGGFAPADGDGRCFDGWSLGSIPKIDSIDSDLLKNNGIQGDELNLVARWGLLIDVDGFRADSISVSVDGETLAEAVGHPNRYTAPAGASVTLSYNGTETVYGWIVDGVLMRDASVSINITTDWTVRLILKLESNDVHGLTVAGFFGKTPDNEYIVDTVVDWVDTTFHVGGATVSFHGDGSVVVSGPVLTGTVEIDHLFLKDVHGKAWRVSVSVTIVSDIVSAVEL